MLTQSALVHSDEFDPMNTRNLDFTVRTRPYTSIATHCALEVFSHFMYCITSKMKEIGGLTVEREIAYGEILDQAEGRRMPRWKNSVLESIAKECVNAGLVNDIDEAYTVIVPAFMKRGLLPKTLHDEIKFDHITTSGSLEETSAQ